MHFFRWFKKDDRIDHPKKTTEAVVTCSSDFERKDVIKESKDSLWDGITKSVMTQPGDVIERLRYSQSNLKDIVADSQQCDQKAYDTAKNAIEKFGSSYYSKVELETLISILNTDLTQGLTPEQVEVSRQKYGSNVLEKQRSKPWIKTFLETFYSGVVILLLVAGVISLVFQDWYQAAAIFLIVGFNSILSTYMETSAGNALSRLANLSAPRCVVIRDKGQRQTISTVDVVVGDIVYLSTGDVIPADLRCFNVTELEVNEAILTGESIEVSKTLEVPESQSPFPSNICFASTSVTSGSGYGLVYATGMKTEVGKIALQLVQGSRTRMLTPLQEALNKLSGLIAMISIGVLFFVLAIAIASSYKDPSNKSENQFLNTFLVAIGFCVSSIPEGLPMIVTISLALGCKAIAEKKGSIRKITAVETLGCCSVICSDKTGTLTEGKMTCMKQCIFFNQRIQCLESEESPSHISGKDVQDTMNSLSLRFYPAHGFVPYGGLFLESELTPSLLEKFHCKIEDMSDMPRNFPNVARDSSSKTVSSITASMALAGFLSSSQATLYKNTESNTWQTTGNTSEASILVASAKCGFATDTHLLKDSYAINPTTIYPQIHALRIPFSSLRKMMCSVHLLPKPNYFHTLLLKKNTPLDDTEAIFTHIAIIKGAPERLINHVQKTFIETDEGVSIDWSNNIMRQKKLLELVSKENTSMAQNSLRVLALAIAPLTEKFVNENLMNLSVDNRLEAILGHSNLTLLGLYGFIDPPREGVSDAIATCHKAGVKVVMITGDQKLTAFAVAERIGLLNFNENQVTKIRIENVDKKEDFQQNTDSSLQEAVVLCSTLHNNEDNFAPYLDEESLDNIVSKALVFARAQPQDKLIIIESLKRQGHVVAMTGDGVNDAPALQSADIGVSMGISGTDVAKGASDLVLLDDNFCTIVTAVAEGRRIYGNIQKFVAFLLGTNIGEIVYLTVAIAFNLKMPVQSLQILFLNLMSDGCPAVALTREQADGDSMKVPPRKRHEGIMNRDWWLYCNIPHTFFEALSVLLCLIVAVYLSTGVLKVNDIFNQCSYENNIKYYCQTSTYLPSFSASAFNGSGFYISIDYWNEKEKKFEYLPYVLYESKPKRLLNPKDIKEVEGCGAKGDEWCKPTSKSQIPDSYMFVNTRQARIAGTQTFITAVYCEMLRAYTIRTWDFFLFSFNTNMWMHLGCGISAVSTILVTLIPKVNSIMNLHPIALWQYALAVGWALLSLVLDEAIPKPLYRRHLRRQRKLNN